MQGCPWLPSKLGVSFLPGPASVLSLPVVRTTWWVLTWGRDGRGGCWVEAAENVLRLRLGYHEDRDLGTWSCGGTWGGTEGGLEGRERSGPGWGLPCRVLQRACGPHERRTKA